VLSVTHAPRELLVSTNWGALSVSSPRLQELLVVVLLVLPVNSVSNPRLARLPLSKKKTVLKDSTVRQEST
jgi:hypothetical protein